MRLKDGYFSGTKFLKAISLPACVTDIPAYFFSQAPKLEKITLPSSIKYISAFAFSNCPSLKEIIFPEGLKEIPRYYFWMNRGSRIPLTLSDGVKTIVIQQSKWLNIRDLALSIGIGSPKTPIRLIDNTDFWKKGHQYRYGAQRIIHLSQNISDSLRMSFLFDTKLHSTIFEVTYLTKDYVFNLHLKNKNGDFLSDFYDSLESFIKFSTYITRTFDKISNLWNLNALSFKPIMQNCGLYGIISDDDSKYFVIDCAIIYCTLLYLKPAGFTSADIDFDKTFLYRYKDVQILKFLQPKKVEVFLKRIYDEEERVLKY